MRTRALILARAATAHLRTGDVEAASATAHQALTHAEQLQSKRLNEHLKTFTDELAASGHAPRAVDVLERAATVTRTEI